MTQPPPPPPTSAPRASGWAGAALTFGILAVLFGLLPVVSLLSYLLGALGIFAGVQAIRRAQEGARGRGLGIAGIITGLMGLGMATAWLVGTIAFFQGVEDEGGLAGLFGESAGSSAAAEECGGFNFGLPDGWPTDLPMPVEYAVGLPPFVGEVVEGELSTLLLVPDTPQSVVDFYVDELEELGYDVIAASAEVDSTGSIGTQISAEGRYNVTVVVTEDVDCTSVFIDVQTLG